MEKFIYARVVFVSGLHWQILSGNPSGFKGEIKKLAKHLKFDLSIVRKTGIPQVGLGATNEGCSAGMMSAAAIVSKTLEIESNQRDFLCATKIPDGRYLYVAQSEGVIVSDGDQIGSSDEIRARLLEDFQIGKKWELIVAPIEWGMEGSTERDFISFLPTKKGKIDLKHPWWRLRPVNFKLGEYLKKSLIPLLIATLVAGVVFGYQTWQTLKAGEDAARAAAANVVADVPPPPPPWPNKPTAAQVASACMEAFNGAHSLWPGNWTPLTASCSAASSSLRITWKRGDYGWARHLLEIEPGAVIAPDGETATLSIPLNLAVTKLDEQLPQESVRIREMTQAAQELRVPLSIAVPPAPTVLPGATNVEPPKPWKELAWTVKAGEIPPVSLIQSIDGSCFRVENIVAQFAGGSISWEIEGIQYVAQ